MIVGTGATPAGRRAPMSRKKQVPKAAGPVIDADAVVRQVRIKGGVPQVQIDIAGTLSAEALAELVELTRKPKDLEAPHARVIIAMKTGPLFDGVTP